MRMFFLSSYLYIFVKILISIFDLFVFLFKSLIFIDLLLWVNSAI